MAGVTPTVLVVPGVTPDISPVIPGICTSCEGAINQTVPRLAGNSGTAAANSNPGNLTLGTALDAIYGPTNNNCPGIWIFLPSTALAAPFNVAGWYWAVMTSTTVGTIYTAQPLNGGLLALAVAASTSGAYTVAVQGYPYPWLPPTAPLTVATGAGAYTAPTTATASIAVTMLGGSATATSAISFTGVASANNTAGAKTQRAVLSAAAALTSPAVVATLALTTGVSGVMTAVQALWAGATNSWRFLTAGATPTFSSFDNSTTIYAGETLQVAVATDWIIGQHFAMQINQT